MSRLAISILLLIPLWAGAQERLTLEQALREALAAHRDARRARLSLRAARLARAESLLRLAPRLELSLRAPTLDESQSEYWSSQGDSLRLVRVDWSQRRESGGLALSQELPLGGRLGLGADWWHRRSDTGSFTEGRGGAWSASLSQELLPRSTLWGDLREGGREAGQAELEALEELADFRHRVATVFLGLLRGQQGLELARQDLEVSRGNRERSQARLDAGLIAESDYLKVELEDLKRRAAFQEDSLALALDGRELLRLLGRGGEAAPELDARLDSIAGAEPDPARAWEALRGGHAGLLRQRLETLKARRDWLRARLERLPSLRLEADWTWREEGEDWIWTPDHPRLDRSLGLALGWPLFAGGERARAAERAGLALRRQELREGELEESLRAELDRLLLRRDGQRARRPLVERQVELAERDARISQERFQAGQITSQDLIDAQRALSLARLALLELAVQEAQAGLDLARLAGTDRETVRGELER
jgi:outer membrane protein TolC